MDEYGDIVEGDYVIEYECYFEFVNGEFVFESIKVKKMLYEFSVFKGCDLKMNLNWDFKVEFVVYFFSGVDEFNIVDCSSLKSIYVAKEVVFCIFDLNLIDGWFDYEEIFIGVEVYSMDI